MATFPRYRLYEDDGVTLVYEFDCVQGDQGAFTDPVTFVEHTSLRGQGSLISEGALAPLDISISFVLQGDDYEDLVDQMDDILTTIETFERYILKIDKTVSTTKDYKVKRILAPQWVDNGNGLERVRIQRGIITFRANSWV